MHISSSAVLSVVGLGNASVIRPDHIASSAQHSCLSMSDFFSVPFLESLRGYWKEEAEIARLAEKSDDRDRQSRGKLCETSVQ